MPVRPSLLALLVLSVASAAASAQTVGEFWSIAPLNAPAPVSKADTLRLRMYFPLKNSDTCREGSLDELLEPSTQRKLRMFEIQDRWTIDWQLGSVSNEATATNSRKPQVYPEGLCFILEQGKASLRGRVLSRIRQRPVPATEPVLVVTSRPGAPYTFDLTPGAPARVSDPITPEWLFLQPLTQPR